MKYLYIFPHPDDESFGPVAGMHQQLSAGHEVYLLTLTRGGATKQRHRLGLTVPEMGAVRVQEMHCVSEKLGLSGMEVLDLPDSGLQEMDPRQLEEIIREHIEKIKPDIIVTYPVHGVSGFHDHLVTHAVVKRVFVQLREQEETYVRRLAFLTLPDHNNSVFLEDGSFRLKHSPEQLIDCVLPLKHTDIQMMIQCLQCYTTYQATILESGVIDKIGDKLYFELYQEEMNPVISDLAAQLIT